MRLLAAAFVSATAAAAAVLLLRPCLAAAGFIDRPNARSSHSSAVVRGVGLSFVGVAAMWAIVTGHAWAPGRWGLYAGATIVAAVGAVDDRRGLLPLVRLSVHIAGALLVIWSGGLLREVDFYGLRLPLGVMAGPVTVLWLVGLTNAYNFMDGIDGLAAGQGAITAGAFVLLASASGASEDGFALAVLAGALAGFLPFNWPPARVFMGDVGSGFLGFVFGAWAVVPGPDRPVVPLYAAAIVLSPFILDTAVTLALRSRRGEVVYSAHRDHFYQRLIRSGWSHRAVTALYLTGSSLLALVTWGAAWSGPVAPWIGLAAVAVFLVIVTLVHRAESAQVANPSG